MSPEASSESSGLPDPPLHVIYSGRVQGVGFRWTCQSIAKRYPVSGSVKNLSDGTVELFADGDVRDVHAFLAEIRTTMSDNIEHAEISSCQEALPFSGFRIVH